MQGTLFGSMYNPNNTRAMLMNSITYLKNCKVLNRELIDYIDVFEKFKTSWFVGEERKITFVDSSGDIIDSLYRG